jgi:hypothetical protein
MSDDICSSRLRADMVAKRYGDGPLTEDGAATASRATFGWLRHCMNTCAERKEGHEWRLWKATRRRGVTLGEVQRSAVGSAYQQRAGGGASRACRNEGVFYTLAAW